jgi:hypothetical protein
MQVADVIAPLGQVIGVDSEQFVSVQSAVVAVLRHHYRQDQCFPLDLQYFDVTNTLSPSTSSAGTTATTSAAATTTTASSSSSSSPSPLSSAAECDDPTSANHWKYLDTSLK